MSLGARLASGWEMLLFDDGPVVGVAAAYTLLREREQNLTPIGASKVCFFSFLAGLPLRALMEMEARISQ